MVLSTGTRAGHDGYMGTRGLVLCGVCGGSLLAALVWSVARESGRPGSATRSSPETEAGSPGKVELLDALEARRVEVLPEARTGSTAGPAPGPLEAPEEDLVRSYLDGRVVDGRAEPVGSAEIWCHEEEHMRLLGRTSGDGWIRLELTLPRDVAARHRARSGPFASLAVVVLAPGFAGARRWIGIDEGRTTHLGTIVLAAGAELAALVLDGRGVPLEGADVSCLPAACLPEDAGRARLRRLEDLARDVATIDWRETYQPRARSGADGRAALRGIEAGSRILAAGARLRETAWSEPIEVVPGSATRELVLRLLPLDPLDLVTGRVVAGDDEPLAGVWVWLEPSDDEEVEEGASGLERLGFDEGDWTSSTFTDDAGRFELVLEERRVCRLHLATTDGGLFETTLDGIAPGTQDLLVRLVAARTIEVRVQDARGEPLAWASVRAYGGLVELGRTGRGALELPRTAFSLQAFAPGYRSQTLGPLEPAAVEDPLVITLEPGQAVRGRVTSDGRPVSGAKVAIRNALPPGTRTLSGGHFIDVASPEEPFDILGHAGIGACDGTTDGRGAFCVTLHGSGWKIVCVEAEGFPATVAGPFEWMEETGAEGVEVEVRRAGAIAGRVIPPVGRSASEFVIAASNGWGVAWTAPVDEQGAYRLEGLAPGSWQVRRAVPPVSAVQSLSGSFWREDLGPIRWDCRVEPDATTAHDLDLSGVEGFVLRGLLTLDGRPPEGSWWAALLEPESRGFSVGRTFGYTQLDASGAFELRLSRETDATLRLRNDFGEGEYFQPLSIPRGVTDWRWDVPTGRLALRHVPGTDDDAERVKRYFVWRGDAERSFFLRLPDPDRAEKGPTSFAVPAGRASLARLTVDLFHEHTGVLDDVWADPREIEVRAGEETLVELPGR